MPEELRQLLSVRNLAVRYGAIEALHDVSVEINRGEIVTLIGSNGAGKTTLLRTISGLLRPAAGEIIWNATDAKSITDLPPHAIVRNGISHVPEGRQVFANLTVRENLLLGGYQQKNKDQLRWDIERCYRLFPVLAERQQQKAGTLSGGEQQMLAIGRALMAKPTLLLLDEPSLGLAPLIVRKIFQIIREINAEGTTVFLVEQNAHMALTIAHRAYVLQTGHVIKTDTAAKLLEDPDVKKAYLGG
ncbi:MAG TPA: ABC transporter ATP-binding protein [Tepidisphaeraceae bacterium]|nr:ABC transporter ATP-binding protein [Tepidisphaeraceae bacterium]